MNIFVPILATVTSIDKNYLQNAKNRRANVVKLVKKQTNEHFRPYLGNNTFVRLKVTSKVLKIEH